MFDIIRRASVRGVNQEEIKGQASMRFSGKDLSKGQCG